MAPRSSDDRCKDAATRFYMRLGMSPKEIFTPPFNLLSSSSNALSFVPRPKLHPPSWSVGLLEILSTLADEVQALPDPTAQQQAEAVVGVSQALINQVDMRIKRQTRTTGKGAATTTMLPKLRHLKVEDVQIVLNHYRANADGTGIQEYEDNEYEDNDGNEEDERCEEEEEEGAGYDSDSQYTEDEGDTINHEDYEGSENCHNTGQRSDLSQTQKGGHRSVDKEPSLLSAPSSAAAAAAHAIPDTNSQDKHAALVAPACEASLPAILNTTSTATAGAKDVVNSVARGDLRTANGVSDSTRPCQSSSSHTLPEASTPGLLPGRLEPLTAVRSGESPVHTPPDTCSQPAFVPNKRPRLSSHCSSQPPSINQAGEEQFDLINNKNGATNMLVGDTSSESGSSPQRLQTEDSVYIMDIEQLSVLDTMVREYTRFDKSATELQAIISNQRAINADHEKTIAREREISSRASAMIKFHQKRLAAARTTIERRTALQDSLEHDLDCFIKEDATDPNVDDLKKVVSEHKHTIDKMKAELPKIGNQLASAQDRWRCSQKDQTTAINRLDRGIKMTAATVAQYDAAVTQKRRWYRAATCLDVKPDELSRVRDSRSVAAEDLHEARMDLGEDQQCVAPQLLSLVPAYQEPK